VKINWDASVDKGRNLMGMGIVARDCEGRLIAALCVPQKFMVDPATAEALAAWKMVELCINIYMESGPLINMIPKSCCEECKSGRSTTCHESVIRFPISWQNLHTIVMRRLYIWRPRGEVPACIREDITAEYKRVFWLNEILLESTFKKKKKKKKIITIQKVITFT
jgi:hypothetical protein